MKEALLYNKEDDGKVRCKLCAHRCLIKPGETGFCGVRSNEGGVLYALTYEKLAAAHIDPIEKKPLYHFYPGMSSYSVSTPGCNFRCEFCQNSSLAQVEKEVLAGISNVSVNRVVEDVKNKKCPSISYTYTEPTVYFEYALEMARLASEHGIKNILVSNGYQTPDCLEMWAPYIDGINIDLKSFRDEFYREFCSTRLEPVLESIKNWYRKEVWIELTTLVIPGVNDTDKEIDDIIDFILSVDSNIVWHISRFAPSHRMIHYPPTPVEKLFTVYEKAFKRGLKYVYIGNILNEQSSSTYCPSCQNLLINRTVFSVNENFLQGDKCSCCGAVIAGRFGS